MRRSTPYYRLKIPLFAFAGFCFAFVLAILPLPNTEIATSLPVVSVSPVPMALAAITVEAPKPTVPSPVRLAVPVKLIENKSQARLYIPSIGVDAVIKEMGYASEGAMAVPNNRFDVGWFALGTRPGDTGSAVISGHNEWTGGVGVFAHLDRLVIGDVMSAVDIQGATTTYEVVGMRTFDADDENSGIFESVSGAHLNLITCSGVWDQATGTYTTRLVVFTDMVTAP